MCKPWWVSYQTHCSLLWKKQFIEVGTGTSSPDNITIVVVRMNNMASYYGFTPCDPTEIRWKLTNLSAVVNTVPTDNCRPIAFRLIMVTACMSSIGRQKWHVPPISGGGANWNSGAAADIFRALHVRNFSPSQFFITCSTPAHNVYILTQPF